MGGADKGPVSECDKKRGRVPISEAKEIIRSFKLHKSLDQEDIRRCGVSRADKSAVIFLDEMDKLCSDSGLKKVLAIVMTAWPCVCVCVYYFSTCRCLVPIWLPIP